MNKINFDQIVSSKPETFSYVTLPEKEEEKVPEQGEDVGQRFPYGHPPGQIPEPLPTLPLGSSVDLILYGWEQGK